MRVKYVRLNVTIGSPGHAGTDINKARLFDPKNKEQSLSTSKDELMDDIFVEDQWLVLEKRRIDAKGKPYLATRATHISNVRDFEPCPDDDEPKKESKPR